MSTLYLVATPIGNLDDLTIRALNIFQEVDAILAEDKRVSSKLLAHYKIKKPLFVWQQHSKESDWQKVSGLLAAEKNLALITDAGTPGVSDPGGQLIAKILVAYPEVKIVPIPGASALTALMSVAGCALDKFLFLGFLPHKKGRQTMFAEIKAAKIPVIFFESVHRILKALDSLADCDKQIILGRELTKQFETIYRGTAKEIKEIFENNPDQVKGEFVLIVHSAR